MQSILFGSPGIGKSTLLCMMAFYLILKHKKNVLVYCRFTNTVQFLLYFGYQDGKLVYFAKQRCKPELAVVIYEELRNRQGSSNVWLMLSGYDYKHIPEGLRTFRVLATAKEVELTPSELDHAYRCLLPCWKKQDLFELGRKIFKFEEGEKEMEVNFSYSGGSVRGFTMDFEDYMRDQERIGLLDGMFYFRFCHTFAKDTKNRDHYLSSTEWEQIFDSVSAVSWMTKEMQSKELLRHFHWARGTGHDALARITFIMCLQRLAIDNALILHVADYDPPKPNEERHFDMERLEMKKGAAFGSRTATLKGGYDKEELTKWRDGDTLSFWYPCFESFLSIDGIVKLQSSFSEGKSRVAFLRVTIGNEHSADDQQLEVLQEILTAEGADPLVYIVLCPDLDACNKIVVNSGAQCQVCVGYYEEAPLKYAGVPSVTLTFLRLGARSGDVKRPHLH